MGSKCQILASLRTRITKFSDLYQIMMVKEIPRNGVIQCIEIAPNDRDAKPSDFIVSLTNLRPILR